MLELRRELTADGLDAGPETIRWHLEQEQLRVLSTSTIRRILHQAGLGVGAKHARKRVLALADQHHITVTDLTTGEVLSRHLIEPNKTYWRNQDKEPGRWPGSST